MSPGRGNARARGACGLRQRIGGPPPRSLPRSPAGCGGGMGSRQSVAWSGGGGMEAEAGWGTRGGRRRRRRMKRSGCVGFRGKGREEEGDCDATELAIEGGRQLQLPESGWGWWGWPVPPPWRWGRGERGRRLVRPPRRRRGRGPGRGGDRHGGCAVGPGAVSPVTPARSPC